MKRNYKVQEVGIYFMVENHMCAPVIYTLCNMWCCVLSLIVNSQGGPLLSEISYPPIYDITSGCRFRARPKDGHPMLFGFHWLTELCILNAKNVEKVFGRPFKEVS